mmetsp:Transcript_31380/g.53164  ORF Transcript_31380/g.53164 Transcript_31380/m.53164 type:complete len:124 (-) Transcript_31380:82-453(-)
MMMEMREERTKERVKERAKAKEVKVLELPRLPPSTSVPSADLSPRTSAMKGHSQMTPVPQKDSHAEGKGRSAGSLIVMGTRKPMNEVKEDWKLFDKSSRGIMKTTGDKYLFVRTMLQRFGADI